MIEKNIQRYLRALMVFSIFRYRNTYSCECIVWYCSLRGKKRRLRNECNQHTDLGFLNTVFLYKEPGYLGKMAVSRDRKGKYKISWTIFCARKQRRDQ